mmetsp:Transcript_29220/g.53555  ORF Transcript_29220/g.53555 Transcript_29220/m.53555 type:complete len:414 (+) Transcript_29220:102-1343(+)
MIISMSAKSLTLLLAASVASATASNLRERRAALAEESTVEPSIILDKSIYAESESITATFSVGSPSHPYYSSSEVPSLNLDSNYPQWSIGLFMRDADPQGGTLSPIVSVNFCGALGEKCDANDRSFASYNDMSVTFGSEYSDLMEGRWPLEISSYGTGFDAYILDGKGAAAIGPLEFNIQSEDDEDADAEWVRYPAPKSSSSVKKPSVVDEAANPLLQFHKGTKKVSRRQHNLVAARATANAAKASVEIVDTNEPEEISSESSVQRAVQDTTETAVSSTSTLTSDKDEYEYDDPVTINFSIPESEDVTFYTIGIFMRMAHPQGGALPAIRYLPLCPYGGHECTVTGGFTTGYVTFDHDQSMMPYEGPILGASDGEAQWPLDLTRYGTGYDVYVLDRDGDDVVGPIKYNMKLDE